MRTYYYGPKDRSSSHRIGVYSANFYLVVCHNIQKARNRPSVVKLMGCKADDLMDCRGCCDSYNAKVMVFLDRDYICHDLIAHEVFHATDRLLNWAGVKLKPGNTEAHAFLCGHLTHLVYNDLKGWGIKVSCKNL